MRREVAFAVCLLSFPLAVGCSDVDPEPYPNTSAEAALETTEAAHPAQAIAWHHTEGFAELRQRAGFYGIGTRVRPVAAGLQIAHLQEAMPAQAAGLLPDDVFVAVDGIALTDVPLEAAINLIRGDRGTSVQLSVVREGEEFDVVLEREHYAQSVRQHVRETIHAREFGGFGIQIGHDERGSVIHHVLPGLPAESANLQSLDIILSVDGISLEGIRGGAAAALLRGAPNSTAVLLIDRQGEVITVSLTRTSIVLPD